MAQEEEVLFPAYAAKCKPSHMQTQELYNEHSEIIVSFRKLDKYMINRESDKTLDFIVALQLSML